jgi:hypothetical protein
LIERWIAVSVVALGFLGELWLVVGFWAEGLGPDWWEERQRQPRSDVGESNSCDAGADNSS